MPKLPFVIQERVRWGDIDLAGIIRYDAYVRFFELAEGEIFRAAGLAIGNLAERLGVWLPRKVLHAEFHSPAVLDEQLSVVAYFTRIGTTSLTINFDVMDDRRETLHASGYEVIVCVGGSRDGAEAAARCDQVGLCAVPDGARGGAAGGEAGARRLTRPTGPQVRERRCVAAPSSG